MPFTPAFRGDGIPAGPFLSFSRQFQSISFAVSRAYVSRNRSFVQTAPEQERRGNPFFRAVWPLMPPCRRPGASSQLMSRRPRKTPLLQGQASQRVRKSLPEQPTGRRRPAGPARGAIRPHRARCGLIQLRHGFFPAAGIKSFGRLIRETGGGVSALQRGYSHGLTVNVIAGFLPSGSAGTQCGW